LSEKEKELEVGSLWECVEDIMLEEEVAELRSLSAEELEARLRAQGVDVERTDALMKEALAKAIAPGKAAGAPVVSIAEARERRRLWPILLVAAAAILIPVFFVATPKVVAYFSPPKPRPEPLILPDSAPTLSPEVVGARTHREKARDECAAENWLDCLVELDRADRADPAGSAAPEWKALRAKASEKLLKQPREEKR
jgi:hypothetical protein